MSVFEQILEKTKGIDMAKKAKVMEAMSQQEIYSALPRVEEFEKFYRKLKVEVRKYFQENKSEILEYLNGKTEADLDEDDQEICWAFHKIRRGYWGDANLGKVKRVIAALKAKNL